MLSDEAADIGFELSFFYDGTDTNKVQHVFGCIERLLISADALFDKIEGKRIDRSALSGVKNIKHILIDIPAERRIKISRESTTVSDEIKRQIEDIKHRAEWVEDEKTECLRENIGKLTDILFDLQV